MLVFVVFDFVLSCDVILLSPPVVGAGVIIYRNLSKQHSTLSKELFF